MHAKEIKQSYVMGCLKGYFRWGSWGETYEKMEVKCR